MEAISPTRILSQAHTKAFLVSNLINIRYLTGIDASFGYVLVRKRTIILFVDARYSEMAAKKAYDGIRVLDISRLKSVLNRIDECGFEADSVTVSQLRGWKKAFTNTKFVQKTGVIEEFRRQKTAKEQRIFKKAQAITQEMLRRIPKTLNVGVSEIQIAEMLRSWSLELGAEGLSFDPIVAFGSHSSRPHHQPTSRRLREGHVVQIDVGARYRGYCADQSEVFFTGDPTPKQLRAYEAVLRAKDAAIAAVAVGITNHELDAIAREVLNDYGVEQYFCHALGHGVGLEIHEGASLSSKAPKQKLLSGEIVTIEPGVYFPGSFGIRLEEEVIVT